MKIQTELESFILKSVRYWHVKVSSKLNYIKTTERIKTSE